MFIYGGNMKKQKIFLKNKQLLGFYLVVGVLFSVISVVAPSISGELVNAVIYRQGDVKVYLFLLVLTYILLLLFSIADQYFFQYFQIKEKNAMRNELFQASLKRGNQEKEQIAAFATVYKGNIIKNLIMDCQSYTKYRPNETTGGIFVSWRRKEELPTGA